VLLFFFINPSLALVSAQVSPAPLAEELQVVFPIPGSATIPPGSTVNFSDPPPEVPPGSPRPRELRFLQVVSYSDQPAILTFDGSVLEIAAPAGSIIEVLEVLGTELPPCGPIDDQPNVVQCSIVGSSRVIFTTSGSPLGEAKLNLGDPRPCIPEPAQRACDSMRTAFWNGDAETWARRGITDPDARFNETVVFRVRAGDPAAISNIARALGSPYLKITRLRFAGVASGQADEFIEISNLGGGPQDMSGWTLRAPQRGIVFRFPSGFVMDSSDASPTRVCRVYTGMVRPESCGGESMSAINVWPDEAGSAVLFFDALALPGDETVYSRDRHNQPPPPNLQLVFSVTPRPR
jgi:hypothetical protein